jgi:hypothetical protein
LRDLISAIKESKRELKMNSKREQAFLKAKYETTLQSLKSKNEKIRAEIKYQADIQQANCLKLEQLKRDC